MANMKQMQEVVRMTFVVALIVLTTNSGIVHGDPEPLAVISLCNGFIQEVNSITGSTIVTLTTSDPIAAADKIDGSVSGGVTDLRSGCGLPEIPFVLNEGMRACLGTADESLGYLLQTPNRLRESQNPIAVAQESVLDLSEKNFNLIEDCSDFLR